MIHLHTNSCSKFDRIIRSYFQPPQFFELKNIKCIDYLWFNLGKNFFNEWMIEGLNRFYIFFMSRVYWIFELLFFLEIRKTSKYLQISVVIDSIWYWNMTHHRIHCIQHEMMIYCGFDWFCFCVFFILTLKFISPWIMWQFKNGKYRFYLFYKLDTV